MTNTGKPFLKWAGGKNQLLSELGYLFPYKKNDSFSFIEPFVGGGAMLFWVLNTFPHLKSCAINDVNKDLIATYRMVQSNVCELIVILKKYEKEYYSLSENLEEKKDYYYQKRENFNNRKSNDLIQSAQFIFLNKTCFNGLYRVNKKNEFNVPVGSYKNPMICDEKNLIAVSQLLKKVKILDGDYQKTINYTDEDTFFYFDPPYKPISDTSCFNSYTQNEFGDSEQIRLKKFCDRLNELSYKWILSNADIKGVNPSDDFFDSLFSAYKIKRIKAKRSINANPSKRGQLTELLILNYGH